MYYSSLNLLVISFDLFPHAWETSRNSDLSKLGYTQLCLWPTKLQGLEKIACSNKRTEGIKIAKVEVADPGEGPWGTPYFSTKMRPEELKKNFLETPLPLSQVWMTPPPPYIWRSGSATKYSSRKSRTVNEFWQRKSASRFLTPERT